MQLFKWWLIYFLVFQLFSCDHKENNVDKFYTKGGGLDYICIPLIKPYRAMLLNGSKEWDMNFHINIIGGMAGDIKKVNVVNGIILLYCNNTLLKGGNVKEAWFVVIPAKHIEEGFGNHNDYVKSLKEKGLNAEPQLFNIEYISDYFNDHSPIDWGGLNRFQKK